MLTAEQIELRHTGIGGSEAAIVAGFSPRMTAFELFLLKTRRLADPYDGDLLSWLGNEIEPTLRRWYKTETGYHVTVPRTTRRRRSRPWMLAHYDGLILAERRGLELKMRAHARGWGPAGSDEIPEDVLLQCTHYMIVSGYRLWDVVALIGGTEIRRYVIPFDQGLADAVLDAEAAFMLHLQTDQPPPLDHTHPTARDVLRRLYPTDNGREIELPPAADTWHRTIAACSEQIGNLTRAKQTAEAQILEMMQYASIGHLPAGDAYVRKTHHRAAYTVDAGEYTTMKHRRTPR